MEEKLKLLVVDDEPDNLDLLYRTFRRDFRVFKATSGAEALDVLDAQGEMAIIISDQRMPKMNGTEFLSKTVERFPDTIRMVLTGYTDVEDLVSAINSGKVFKYITKPWNPKKLKVVIAQAAETYSVIKNRTHALSRALRQESVSNNIMAAVRGSLDYDNTLKTVVTALGQAFDADFAILYPVEDAQSIDSDIALPTYRPLSEKTLSEETLNEEKREEALEASIEKPVVEASDDQRDDLCSESTIKHSLEQLIETLPPIPINLNITSEFLDIEGARIARVVVPFSDKDQLIARVCLYRQTADPQWASSAIDLLENVSDQVALAILHAKLYLQLQRQSFKMRAELEVARQIQSNLLHQSWPETPGLRIQARCQPAREVGGDFFEVFMHPQGDIWLAVGDVSGKGVPAALFMASAISVLRRELAQEKSPDPDKVMSNLNHSLANDLMSNNCFITMALIRYSAATGELVYANAGHVYPVVWSHKEIVARRQESTTEQQTNQLELSGVTPTYLDVRGVPLGILPKWRAASGKLQLASGDVVLLTSDGITEATLPSSQENGSGVMLNQEGLWDFLQRQPADLDLDNLLSYIHLPEGEQEDDQTILSLEVTSC
ncbi:MAG: SpoIIE family protein phosphatase [Cyanobacteria bacterium J06573_11]